MNSSAIRSPTTSTRRPPNASTSDSSRSLRSASPGSGWTDRAISIWSGISAANSNTRSTDAPHGTGNCLHGDAPQASLGERALAQHAGAAPHVVRQHDALPPPERARFPLVGGAEQRHHVDPE